eukprot:m.53587 g.53587  ORF g.53587 m.53587 type:complete len:532 (-) comp13180_c0_seq2:151-1746(-)
MGNTQTKTVSCSLGEFTFSRRLRRGETATLPDGRVVDNRALSIEVIHQDARNSDAYVSLAADLSEDEQATLSDGRTLSRRALLLEAVRRNPASSLAYIALGASLKPGEAVVLPSAREQQHGHEHEHEQDDVRPDDYHHQHQQEDEDEEGDDVDGDEEQAEGEVVDESRNSGDEEDAGNDEEDRVGSGDDCNDDGESDSAGSDDGSDDEDNDDDDDDVVDAPAASQTEASQSQSQSQSHKLFVSTYLGFGANKARERYVLHLWSKHYANRPDLSEGDAPLHIMHDPCMPNGLEDRWSLERPILLPNGTYVSMTRDVLLVGIGNFDLCHTSLLDVLLTPFGPERGNCTRRECVLNGIFQPPPTAEMEWLGLAEFWYSSHDVLGLEGRYRAGAYRRAASTFCARNWSDIEADINNHRYPHAGPHRMRMQCFKSVWVRAMLHAGHQIKSSAKLNVVDRVGDILLHWPLGAMLHVLQRDHQNLKGLCQSLAPAPDIYTPSVKMMSIMTCIAVCALLCAFVARPRDKPTQQTQTIGA